MQKKIALGCRAVSGGDAGYCCICRWRWWCCIPSTPIPAGSPSHVYRIFHSNIIRRLLQRHEGLLVSALMTSLELAAYSCGLSLVIGTARRGPGHGGGADAGCRGAVETLALLPVMIPEIILGFALMAVFTFAGVKNDMVTLVHRPCDLLRALYLSWW